MSCVLLINFIRKKVSYVWLSTYSYVCIGSVYDVCADVSEYGSTFSDPERYQRGPHFVMQPQDVIYDSDNQDKFATIECEAEGNPDPTYKWYRTSEQNTQQIRTERDK